MKCIIYQRNLNEVWSRHQSTLCSHYHALWFPVLAGYQKGWITLSDNGDVALDQGRNTPLPLRNEDIWDRSWRNWEGGVFDAQDLAEHWSRWERGWACLLDTHDDDLTACRLHQDLAYNRAKSRNRLRQAEPTTTRGKCLRGRNHSNRAGI